MKNTLEYITNTILAERILFYLDSKKLVNWAIQIIQMGYENEDLYILAGADSDTTEEREKYFWKIINDLKIEYITSNDELIEFYAINIAQKAVNKEIDIDVAFNKMLGIVSATSYDSRYFAFEAIKEDLDYLHYTNRTIYRDSLTLDNYKEYILEEFNIFLEIRKLKISEKDLNSFYCNKCKKFVGKKFKKKFQLKRPFQYCVCVCEICNSKDLLFPHNHLTLKLLIEKYKKSV